MNLSQTKEIFAKELKHLYNPNERNFIWKLLCKSILNIEFFNSIFTENKEIDSEEEHQFLQMISELKKGVPVAYALGEAHFYGFDFKVNPHVLIPRPETEELVELCLNELKKAGKTNAKVLEIGTGSGCISISLAKNNPNLNITACDISGKALSLAKENAEIHQVNIQFLECNYLENNNLGIFDVYLSNPPYIALEEHEEIEDSVKKFEPNIALFAPKNRALAFYEKIVEEINAQKPHPCYVFVEINQKLGSETLKLFETNLDEAYLLNDLSGNPRFVWGKTGF